MTPFFDMQTWFRSLTLARKLWLTICLLAGGLSLLTLWQVAGLHRSSQTLLGVFENRLVPIQRLRIISDAYGTAMVHAARAVRAGSLSASEGQARLQAALERAQKALASLQSQHLPEDETLLLQAVEKGMERLQPKVATLDEHLHLMDPSMAPLEILVAGPAGAALGRFLDAEFLPLVNALTVDLNALADLKEARAKEAVETEVRRAERTKAVASFLIFLGFIAAMLLGRHLANDFGGAIRRLGEFVRKVADGALDQRVQIRGQDELSALAGELNRMSQQLQDSVETLRQREATQRSLLRSARTMIYTAGLDDRIQSFNLAAEQMLGYSADAVVGQFSPTAFHDPTELQEYLARLNEAHFLRLSTPWQALTYLPGHGQTEQREWTFIRRDGSRFPGLAVASPIRNDDGELLAFLMVVTDVSAQKAAEQFQARLQAVMDLTPDFVAMAEIAQSSEGGYLSPPRLVYQNKAFQQLRICASAKGRSPDLLFSFFPPREVQRMDEVAMPAVLSQGHWRGETFLVGPMGLDFPVDLVLMAHRNLQGEVSHLSLMARDIRKEKSRERLLREREARLQAINQASPVGIFLTDPDGTLSFVNRAFELITGLEKEGLPFKNWMESLHPEDYPIIHAAWPVVLSSHAPFDSEARFLHPDGTLRWARILAAPVSDDDRFLGYVVCLLDLTELRQAHAELQQSQARALAASQAKSSFLSNMSHELRTPLNAILGYAQLMARGLGRSEGDREHLGRIHNAGEHLLGLINDVLSIAKIESGKLTLNVAPFDTTKLFRTLHDVVSVRAQAKNLDFRLDLSPGIPERLEGDEGKLRQVLVNLLGNAVKFTATGRVVFFAEYRDGFATFSVEDTGPGISPADQARLFESFYQTGGVGAAEGTGLGLTISRAIVRQMGGDIEVQSEVGRGSAFSFRIPLAASDVHFGTPLEGKVLRVAPGQRTIKCLVVDDGPDNRDLLCQLLQAVGIETRAAEDGQEALELWKAWGPDLIWMDLRMPRLDGFGALRSIREEEAREHRTPTCVVAITASVIDQNQATMRAQGFDDFLGKPFREEVIFSLLTQHLGIDFLREEPSALSLEPLSLNGLRTQPKAWKDTFREAVSSGDSPGALVLADAVEDTGLAQALRQRLKAYQLEALLEALDE